MKFCRFILLGLMLSCAIETQVSAAPTAPAPKDYNFQQERMLLSSNAVFVISSFDTQDHITAYTYYGVRLWNAPFHAKILSWQQAGDYIFVFSKDRKGNSTYLTCMDKCSGELVWQRP
ncbi:MAG: hypothetical protein H0W50_04620 [Parachlamydiaceae bacterium]|nr:hypothetical protein [Parachlamydiaceae bacterium]